MSLLPLNDFSSGYIRRVIDNELDELFPGLPAVLLDGPKGVGKTDTALQRASTIWRLDRPDPRSVAEADPDLTVAGKRPVLLDEWQRVPTVWDAVKRAVDASSAGGQFLLTGSAPTGGTHSGAGRINTIRMRPLTIPERGASRPSVSLADLLAGGAAVSGACSLRVADYTDLILSSGFPGFQPASGRALNARLDGYVDRIVDIDLEEAGLSVRRPATLRGWLRAYAAATATTASWEVIRNAATAGTDNKPAKSTTYPYVDALTQLRVLDEVPAWLPGNSHLKRIGQAAKHHLADPALAARLAGTSRSTLLQGQGGPTDIPRDGPFLGALFESLATLSVRVFAQAADAGVSHLRTRDGDHEVDLIVEGEGGRVLALEVKLSGTVDDHDVRHLLWLKQRIGDQLADAAVLTTGEQAYRRPDGIAVVPLGALGP